MDGLILYTGYTSMIVHTIRRTRWRASWLDASSTMLQSSTPTLASSMNTCMRAHGVVLHDTSTRSHTDIATFGGVLPMHPAYILLWPCTAITHTHAHNHFHDLNIQMYPYLFCTYVSYQSMDVNRFSTAIHIVKLPSATRLIISCLTCFRMYWIVWNERA